MKKMIVLLVACMLVFSACSKGDSKIDAIKSAKQITMYTNAEFPPYEFMENNEIVGVDVEIGKAIAKKLGVELVIKNAEFAGIVASIASGKGDLGLSGITINDSRKESVDFSHPYTDSVQYIILPIDSSIEVVEDLAGKALGVQTGTTGAMLVEEEIEKGVLAGTNTELKPYNSAPVAMQDLIAGRISAVVIDELVAISVAAENSGYMAIPFIYENGVPVTEQFGVAIKKGNEDLLKIINEVIDDMVSKGLIEQYIDQYSGM